MKRPELRIVGVAFGMAKEVVVYTDVRIIMEARTRGSGLEGTLVAVGDDAHERVSEGDEVEDAVRAYGIGKRR